MTRRAPDHGGELTSEPASTNLYTLATNLISLQRMLDRRTADGTLVQADPGLIRSAIAAGRGQVTSVKAMLGEMLHGPTDPWRQPTDGLIAAVADFDSLLDTLEEMLSQLGS
ncbi:hypothetical protein [Methylobacterium sp. J-070]|uniref:hypothetical protein n=1 Tax=Methylobacterium sp. J-070 TaxID=2836650 RepID=UPI001FB881DA|nr:hypothetical protein [Methylobacterium sp. J-070]MCJ2054128.1 hypothetical protein [Methylobacterium sp. J-070]